MVMQGGAVRVPVLVVLLAAALALPFAGAQPWVTCSSTSGNYSSGSTYEDNLFQLMVGLQANASSSPAALFAAGSAGGAGADAVYGLILCRGDLSSNDCYDCGTFARRDVQRVCNRTRDVVLVYNACYLRVSDSDFLASPNNSGETYLISGTNISSSVDVAAYDRAVTTLLNTTARYAAETSARLFATGQLVGLHPTVPNIWSAAQCAADLSPVQCRTCLDDLVAKWFKFNGGRGLFNRNERGARIAGARCNLRSELGDKFYTGEPMVKLQANGQVASPLAPAPSLEVLPGLTGDFTFAGGKSISVGKVVGIILPVVFVGVVVSIIRCVWNTRYKRRYQRPGAPHHIDDDLGSIKSTLFSLSSLRTATNNFSESCKLGEGGFGAVYKGNLSGQEVAVKRLSKGSGQGLEELRNELVLVAKLHHKNLVRLEGFCLEDGEKLLVYEYMPNKSLDTILFEPEEQRRLDWRKRFNIIEGVARGLQYLHEDSRKKIVHRDMKASNVLLDADMNPKIGDFGLARLFAQDQTRDVTSRIVGTFGYMSPEYVMRGQFSTKSDVFSFGILVMEIITGRRNSGNFFREQNEDIISIVWRHWSEGTIAEIVDASLGRNYSETQVLKCVNIGMWCLQQNPVERPAMSEIVVMLNNDDTTSLPPVARPTFFFDGTSGYSSYTSGSYPTAIAKAAA